MIAFSLLLWDDWRLWPQSSDNNILLNKYQKYSKSIPIDLILRTYQKNTLLTTD
jgi:hypothetical protein